MDAGAYCTLSPVVLSRGVIHATGPYRCDHVRIRGRAMMTHTPPNGAFRGFGAPQTQFADRGAPRPRRRGTRPRSGSASATGTRCAPATRPRPGSVWAATPARCRCCARRCGGRGSATKRRQWRGTGRGIGLSLVFHGSGFTGSGETKLASEAALELTATGARIRVASTEIGQGTRHDARADRRRRARRAFDARRACTRWTPREVPDSGPTVASRTCMIVGGLLERCARRMRARLGGR